jgi:hypothetical protein
MRGTRGVVIAAVLVAVVVMSSSAGAQQQGAGEVKAPVAGPPPPPAPAPQPLQVATEPPAAQPQPQVAQPQPEVAVGPPPPPPPQPPVGLEAEGLRMTGGRAFTEEIDDGWFGRVETEHLWVGSREHASGVGGVSLGLEGWGSRRGGGGGIPMSFWGGFHSPVLSSTVGLGWEWALYDDVKHDGGFGILAPLAVATLGLDFDSVRIMADGRAQYRWNWGAEDRWQLTLGVSVGIYSLE